MPPLILIIAPAHVAEPVAKALQSELKAEVEIAPHRRAGLSSLRANEFSLVLLDELLSELEPKGTYLLYQNAGAAPVLELNFTLSRAPRVVRQVRAALLHRAQNEVRARAAAIVFLQNELNASLTGILLETQLALRDALPSQEPKLRHLVEMACVLRNRLRA